MAPRGPVARTKAPKGDSRQPVILTETQYEALLAVCEDPMVQLYVLLLGETGARSESEALWLKWEDIDLEGGFVKIVSGRDDHRTKSGRSRHVPLTDRLKQALKEHFAAYRFGGSPWVFHHTRLRPSSAPAIALLDNSLSQRNVSCPPATKGGQ